MYRLSFVESKANRERQREERGRDKLNMQASI
jgi:hypothetical protein